MHHVDVSEESDDKEENKHYFSKYPSSEGCSSTETQVMDILLEIRATLNSLSKSFKQQTGSIAIKNEDDPKYMVSPISYLVILI